MPFFLCYVEKNIKPFSGQKLIFFGGRTSILEVHKSFSLVGSVVGVLLLLKPHLAIGIEQRTLEQGNHNAKSPVNKRAIDALRQNH